jgi:hypothetical protein
MLSFMEHLLHYQAWPMLLGFGQLTWLDACPIGNALAPGQIGNLARQQALAHYCN